jgi:hypothetical protein
MTKIRVETPGPVVLTRIWVNDVEQPNIRRLSFEMDADHKDRHTEVTVVYYATVEADIDGLLIVRPPTIRDQLRELWRTCAASLPWH